MGTEEQLKNKLNDLVSDLYGRLAGIEPKAAFEYAKKIIVFDSKMDDLLRKYEGTMGLVDKEIKMVLQPDGKSPSINAYGIFKRMGMIKTQKSIFIVTIYCDRWFYEGNETICLDETEFGAHEIEDIEIKVN
ncbi:MAG: hypothetical protein Q7J54_06800 [Candidatus Woesearchaeota archaeon]|nr:hypothetical protein [Candidatus Woesearchaeota archaeon]